MKIYFMAIGISLLSQLGMAQIGGNQLYENSHGNNYAQNTSNIQKVYNTEDNVVYKISILNNVKADSYVITLGLNEEGISVASCNKKINQRINGYKSALNKLGVKPEDIYVDFISQTKIYDYKSNSQGNQVNINQVDKGFEIKKNIIIKVKDILLFDDLVETASEYDIHNIIKVDYHAHEKEKIYDEMYEEALAILGKRVKQNQKFSKSKHGETPVLSINFYSVQPKKQYHNFQAFETSDISYVNNYYNSNKILIRQEERKSRTFYYDGLKPDNFDKIINPDATLVGLQYVMEMTITYTSKKKTEEKPAKDYQIITPNGELKKVNLD